MIESKLHNTICVGKNSKFYSNLKIGKGTIIGNNVVIGYPKEAIIEQIQKFNKSDSIDMDLDSLKLDRTHIGEYCRIASNVVIYSGAFIGNNVSVDDFCRIGFDSRIGDDTLLMYRAYICDRVKIGKNCKIAGFVCDGASVGNNSTMMGILLHKYREPETWGLIEDSPKIGDKVVIGYDAKVIGGVKIEPNSYIAAGSIVTKDVPSKTIVFGVNHFISSDDWNGKMKDKYFWRWGCEGFD